MSYFTTDTYIMKREIINFSNKLSSDIPKKKDSNLLIVLPSRL